jgi:hypothetical protein
MVTVNVAVSLSRLPIATALLLALAGAIMNHSVVLTWGVVAVLGLQGCSSEPSLTSGNKRGGIISNVNVGNKAAASAVADSHCRQYGEVARITVVDLVGNRVKFLCSVR